MEIPSYIRQIISDHEKHVVLKAIRSHTYGKNVLRKLYGKNVFRKPSTLFFNYKNHLSEDQKLKLIDYVQHS